MHRILQFTARPGTARVNTLRNRMLRQVTALAGIGLDDNQRYALLLCVSEAIDNGIKHGGGRDIEARAELLIEVDLDTRRQRLRVTVTDGGRTVPSMNGHVSDLEATGGRGLAVIGGYADAVGWGQRMNDVGEVVGWSVWFELDVTPLPANGQATAQAEVQPKAPCHTTVSSHAETSPRLPTTTRHGEQAAA